jgi:hypothetical protein
VPTAAALDLLAASQCIAMARGSVFKLFLQMCRKSSFRFDPARPKPDSALADARKHWASGTVTWQMVRSHFSEPRHCDFQSDGRGTEGGGAVCVNGN